MQRKSLGKGLSALLSGTEEEYENATRQNPHEVIQSGEASSELPLVEIYANPDQPRKSFDKTAMAELTNSIRIHGVISPIIVVKRPDGYMIIAGERRYRAAKAAALKTIPAIVRSYSTKEIREISLIDNLQRENLNPIETANAIKQLMDEYRYTQEEVAERVGKSRPAVANTLRLLTLPQAIADLVARNRLSEGHARCLIGIADLKMQLELANSALDGKISVRELEKRIKDYKSPKAKQKPIFVSLELRDLIERMQRVFSTKVSAIGNDKKGRIYIDYFTSDDLDRIFELIEYLERK